MTDKVLLLGDVHLSDRVPVNCTDSYLDDLFDLLYQTYNIAKLNNVAAIIQAGDLFDNPRPDRNSHRLVQRTIEWAKESPVPLHIVSGNHDQLGHRKDSILETQPLGVLVLAGVINLLDGWAEDIPAYGVPWLQDWTSDNLELELQAYHED